MNNMEKLNHLAPIADEMLAGLQADETMRLKALRAAREQARPQRRRMKRFAPALAFAAAALVCIGVASLRMEGGAPAITPVTIDEIAAGSPAVSHSRMIADLGDGANVRMGRSAGGSLFAEGSGEIPLVAVDGHVYRMLSTPQDLGGSLLGKQLGSVSVVTDQPSLAAEQEMQGGLSNVASQSAAIYAVGGLRSSTAVAAEVGGSMRLFQRVSYAGKGPAGSSFEDTFSVRGKVKALALDGVGELTGGKAGEVMNVLLNCATLHSADAGSARQYLTVTLDSGLKLQLGVSGDVVSACGSWSCPEFFEAFEAAMQ